MNEANVQEYSSFVKPEQTDFLWKARLACERCVA